MVFTLLLALHGKPYYIGPVYPALFAAGAVQVEAMGETTAAEFVNWGAVTVLVAYGIVVSPLGLPFLQPERMADYGARLGRHRRAQDQYGRAASAAAGLRRHVGMEEAGRAVGADLPKPAGQAPGRAVILAGNYGEAGALGLYGPRYRLPPPVSPAGSFWFFGPGTRPGRVVLAIGLDPEVLGMGFQSVREVGRVGDPWAVAEERNVPIVLAAGPRRRLQQAWLSLGGLTDAGARQPR